MNNKLKWFITIFLTTVVSSFLFYLLILFSQRLTIGIALLYKDVFWMASFYPSRFGSLGSFVIFSYNYMLPFSVFLLVVFFGVFIECFRKINPLKFILGFISLFFISVSLFLLLLVVTNNGSVLYLSKYLIVAPVYLIVFKFKDYILNK